MNEPEAGAPPTTKGGNPASITGQRRHAHFEVPKGFGADYAFIFPREHWLRRPCIQLVNHRYFDRFIVAAIMLNSIILGFADFSVVGDDLNPASVGKKFENGVVVDATSTWNLIVEMSELPFAVIFGAECLLKIMAMGFIRGKGSYLDDSWNRLDFIVVISSPFTLLSAVPGISNVSSLRTIRVLRPLRSLSVIPGMRRLISSLLKALPALGNVVVLQVFVFFIFGILGIQLFGGSMNRRCRITEFPVKLPLNTTTQEPIWPVPDDYLSLVTENPSAYRCLDEPLLDYEDDALQYTKETSPWNTTRECFWPVYENDTRLCAGPGKAGMNNCTTGQTCGSNYDAYGNPRFSNPFVMAYALNTADLNWGYTRFDDIGTAFFTIFQSITQEGWTVIMYMVMDSSQPLVGVVFFIFLIIFASFFVMNLTLAVISEEFNLDESPRGLTAEEKKAVELKAKEEEEFTNQSRRSLLTTVVSHRLFSGFIMVVILANTIVLSLDHHPMSDTMSANLETANFALSCVFVIEMVMKLGGLGLRQYARDKFNLFDAFIVTMGILETIASPPSFMSGEDPKPGAVSALRSFRLFRVFKLARDWRSLRELLEMIVRAVASIANFAVLLILFIYIYALVGVQFFGNTMCFDDAGNRTERTIYDFWHGTVPRNNFDTLLWSVLTVFQVITGENWNSIMYDAMRGNHPVASIYFISLVIMGDFVLMNLFLALLLDNFGSDDEEQVKEKEEETKKLAQKMSVMSMKVTPISENERTMSRASFILSSDSVLNQSRRRQSIAEVEDENDEEDVRTVNLETFADEITPSIPLANPVVIDSPPRFDVPRVRVSAAGTNTRSSVLANARKSSLQNGSSGALGNPRNSVLGTSRTSVSHIRASVLSNARGSVMSNARLSILQADAGQDCDANQPDDPTPEFLQIPPGKSLFLFSETSHIRRWAFWLSVHPIFDKVVFGWIVLSSIALALDNPLNDPDSDIAVVLGRMDKVFAVIFTLEMMIKVVALGLVAHKGSYLRNGWNIIDCVIVISSLVMLVIDAISTEGSTSLKSLRSLRSLRTFRPLRMISRRPGLKLVVNALIEAIPEVLNVFFLCMLLYLIFSIIAVNSLKGTFYACSGDEFDSLSEERQAFLETPRPWSELLDYQQEWFMNGPCAGFPSVSLPNSKYICECWDLEWTAVIPENFDNVWFAMLTLFEIATTEGWADVMMAAIDSTGVGNQPIRDHNMNWAFFFVTFLVVGSFFVMNLFVGVIIDNFNRMKAALGGDFMLTPEQKKWIEAQKTASRVGPVRILKPPRHRVRRAVFYIVKAQRFEWFIMICIIVNTLLMSAQYFGESTLQAFVITIVNEVLAGIFTLEAAMKLTAYAWDYFNDTWNQFDFFVVVGTLGSIVVEMVTGTSVRSVAMLVRIFRVTRIVRLVKSSKSIRQILQTLYIALPGLSNITSILFLMIFIYTTMGVQLFAKVAINTSSNLNSLANFQNFGKGFLFLLRAATGEAWNSCMHDFAYTDDVCTPDPEYNSTVCGFNNFEGCTPLDGCGKPMAAYVFFCSFTLLVTYVMLNLTIAVILESFSQSHEDEEPLFEPELLEEFQTKWADIDPKATGFVKAEKLLVLVNILKPPLGRFGMPFDMSHFFHYMRGLAVPMYRDETVNFKDVLLAMTREMVKGTMAGDPNAISEIGQTHEDEFSRPRIEFFAHEFFAIRRIQKSVAQWLHTKRQLEKEYMEEYKNKIKKPSGRPKKQRDARVFTIG